MREPNYKFFNFCNNLGTYFRLTESHSQTADSLIKHLLI